MFKKQITLDRHIPILVSNDCQLPDSFSLISSFTFYDLHTNYLAQFPIVENLHDLLRHFSANAA
jgi:hypothetical protein